MEVFTGLDYIEFSINSFQAKKMAAVSNNKMEAASFILYGRYDGTRFHDMSSFQKPGDTHCLLAYAPKMILEIDEDQVIDDDGQ